MNSKFFADPADTIRVNFSTGPMDGEWIKIRARLSDSEEKRLSYGVVTGFNEKKEPIVDLTGSDLRVISTWVTRWSLGGDHERGNRPAPDELSALLPEHAEQILGAINDHIADVRRERELLADPKPESGSPAPATLTPLAETSSTQSTSPQD